MSGPGCRPGSTVRATPSSPCSEYPKSPTQGPSAFVLQTPIEIQTPSRIAQT